MERWARIVPSGLLVGVALLQIALAHTSGLSPWSGGGFGMFSTIDAGQTRHLHVFVIRPGIVREVFVPPALDELQKRALTLPSRSHLGALARELAALPSPDEGEPAAVRIQVWRTRHDPQTLAPAGEMVRSLEVALDGD